MDKYIYTGLGVVTVFTTGLQLWRRKRYNDYLENVVAITGQIHSKNKDQNDKTYVYLYEDKKLYAVVTPYSSKYIGDKYKKVKKTKFIELRSDTQCKIDKELYIKGTPITIDNKTQIYGDTDKRITSVMMDVMNEEKNDKDLLQKYNDNKDKDDILIDGCDICNKQVVTNGEYVVAIYQWTNENNRVQSLALTKKHTKKMYSDIAKKTGYYKKLWGIVYAGAIYLSYIYVKKKLKK